MIQSTLIDNVPDDDELSDVPVHVKEIEEEKHDPNPNRIQTISGWGQGVNENIHYTDDSLIIFILHMIIIDATEIASSLACQRKIQVCLIFLFKSTKKV